nr:aspartate--tRNA ligase [Bacteriovoracaceae bacterium]
TTRIVRETLYNMEFTEVETPILYKTTPEGARDYIVPSRVHPGKVYALPQSPQTLKQLLMISNMDRYFQICRCFRDEDLRADRQPEFTQIDIEVSFGTQEFMKCLAEEMLRNIFGLDDNFTLAQMTYAQVLADYGSDKPDIRYDLKHKNVTALFANSPFQTFKNLYDQGGMVKMMFLPGEKGMPSRKQIDELPLVVKPYGGKGVAWLKYDGKDWSGPIAKFLDDKLTKFLQQVREENKSTSGTYFFMADANEKVVHDSSDALRRSLAKEFKLFDENEYRFLWVTEFPLLEYDSELKRFFACHHPFTAPMEEDYAKFYSKDVEQIKQTRAQAYDLVCNGYELGGGSMRIFNQKDQSRMFDVLGMAEGEVKNKFGFFIEALRFGTPPHGGMAWGLDRLIMILAKTDNLRDVIAFPKTANATDLMAQAPSVPGDDQLKELHMNFINQSTTNHTSTNNKE